MTHYSTNLEQARKRDKAHNGRAERIRQTIARAGEPLSPTAISLRLGMDVSLVRRTIATMICQTGGIVSVKTGRGIAYRLYKGPEQKAPSENPARIAGRIEIGRGAVWGASLV